MDFSKEDLLDAETFNRILWKGLMGRKPYPGNSNGSETAKRSDDDE
jgi:hypothetical protein